MEYVHAAILLHKLNKEINEDTVSKIVEAAGVVPDKVKIKALVSALGEVKIDEALKSAAIVTAAPAAPQGAPAAQAAEKAPSEAEKAKVEEKKEEEALAGLSSLFG